MYDEDYDDFDDYEKDEEDFCYHCQNRGYIPAMDYEVITGIEGWACDHCDRGVNSNYSYRPTQRTSDG